MSLGTPPDTRREPRVAGGAAKCGILEVPIHYLPTEIARWRDPPPAIRAGKFLHEGRLLVQEGKYQEAIADFDKVIAIEPRFTEAFVDRAALRITFQDHAGAGQDLEVALRHRPDDPRSLLLRGMLYMALGDPPRAVADFARPWPAPWTGPSDRAGGTLSRTDHRQFESRIAANRSANQTTTSMIRQLPPRQFDKTHCPARAPGSASDTTDALGIRFWALSGRLV